MTDSTTEIISQTPLDLTLYNHWRDHLYYLQVGDSLLDNEAKERSSQLGHYARSIGQRTVLGLREGRLDPRNKQPFVIPVNEVSDEQVLIEASSTELKQFFLEAVNTEATHWWWAGIDDRQVDFATAAIAMGMTLTQTSIDQIKQELISSISTGALDDRRKRLLTNEVNRTGFARVKKLIDLMRFSQTQMTLSERTLLARGFKPEKKLGEEQLEIDGKVFEFVGGVNISGLSERDLEVIEPFRRIIYKGRREMVAYAKEFAATQMGIKDNKIYDPPEWWLKGEDAEGLDSREILIYLPYPNYVPTHLHIRQPDFIQELWKEKGDNFRSGWYKLAIGEKDGEQVITEIVSFSS